MTRKNNLAIFITVLLTLSISKLINPASITKPFVQQADRSLLHPQFLNNTQSVTKESAKESKVAKNATNDYESYDYQEEEQELVNEADQGDQDYDKNEQNDQNYDYAEEDQDVIQIKPKIDSQTQPVSTKSTTAQLEVKTTTPMSSNSSEYDYVEEETGEEDYYQLSNNRKNSKTSTLTTTKTTSTHTTTTTTETTSTTTATTTNSTTTASVELEEEYKDYEEELEEQENLIINKNTTIATTTLSTTLKTTTQNKFKPNSTDSPEYEINEEDYDTTDLDYYEDEFLNEYEEDEETEADEEETTTTTISNLINDIKEIATATSETTSSTPITTTTVSTTQSTTTTTTTESTTTSSTTPSTTTLDSTTQLIDKIEEIIDDDQSESFENELDINDEDDTDDNYSVDETAEEVEVFDRPKLKSSNNNATIFNLTFNELLKSPALIAGICGGLLVGIITALVVIFLIIYRMRRKKYDDSAYMINANKSANIYGNPANFRPKGQNVTLLSSSSVSPNTNLSTGSTSSATTGLLNGHTMTNSRLLKYVNNSTSLKKTCSILSSDSSSSSSPNHDGSFNYAYIKAPTKEFYA